MELHPADEPEAALVLGHGAGGGIAVPDLKAATKVANAANVSVALVEQPYLVAGRKSPAPARQLDAAWISVIEQLHEDQLSGLPLIAGGRSAGARVACRTFEEVGAVAVLCLAFPVHAPGKGDDPSKSRLSELDAVTVPTLVVQGDKDPFGMPTDGPNRKVVVVPGNHSLKSTADVEAAVAGWLTSLHLQLPS